MSEANAIEAYWSRAGIGQAILDALAALGKDVKALTVDDLAPLDQFHGGGKPATLRLARLAALQPDTRVLDCVIHPLHRRVDGIYGNHPNRLIFF